MSGDASWPLALLAALAGSAAGWLHFRSLRPLADRIVAGDRSAIVMQVLRLGGMAGFLVLAAYGGALVLLAAAAGVFAGRWLVLRAHKRGAR